MGHGTVSPQYASNVVYTEVVDGGTTAVHVVADLLVNFTIGRGSGGKEPDRECGHRRKGTDGVARML